MSTNDNGHKDEPNDNNDKTINKINLTKLKYFDGSQATNGLYLKLLMALNHKTSTHLVLSCI